MATILLPWVLAVWLVTLTAATQLSTYQNPVLPGWHSDPSCVFVKEWDETFFCTTSSFLTFPGAPVYASKDLIHWKHISNAYNRRDDIPEMLTSTSGQQEGLYAATLRFHRGKMYLVTLYISLTQAKLQFLLWTTTNPFDNAAWEGPVAIPNPTFKIDPDLFWDGDDLYIASSGLFLQQVDLQSGTSTEPVSLWNGTGGANVEGPHLYKKDGWYYLLAAEGGTETNHSVTMARSRNIWGPYESAPNNPLFTNRGTTEYFQTVGHADLFQDRVGNWWGVALATRSGPDWAVYPMGREMVLFPVEWSSGDFPIMEPVRGHMVGPLLSPSLRVPGDGQWADAGDTNLPDGKGKIPSHFVHWRPPPNRDEIYRVVSDKHHQHQEFLLKASIANLTGTASYKPTDGQTFLARKQAHTGFIFSIDVDTGVLTNADHETGLSVFLTSYQHIDLSIIMLGNHGRQPAVHVQLRIESLGKPDFNISDPVIQLPLPRAWNGKRVTLLVEGNETRYDFYASLSPSSKQNGNVQFLGTVSAEAVSGGSGPFSGTLLGAFATTNGGSDTFDSRVSRWKYTPISQKVE
ncbi:glycosyl hydrolase [Aspergillus californicus]